MLSQVHVSECSATAANKSRQGGQARVLLNNSASPLGWEGWGGSNPPPSDLGREGPAIASMPVHQRTPKWDTFKRYAPNSVHKGDKAQNPVDAAQLLPHSGRREGT